MSHASTIISVYAVSMAGQALEREIATALAWMCPDERETYQRFHFERHRREFAISRFLLRGTLGELTGWDPKGLSFLRQGNGKPCLDGTEVPSFNLTHTDDFVALITGPPGSSLGLDAEPLDRKFDSLLLNHVFNEAELQRIAGRPDDEALPVSYWTAKEAYLKQIGTGLSVEPKRLSLTPRPPGGMEISLDGRLDPACALHFTTIGAHRLCAATEAPEPPRLYLYHGRAWRPQDGVWFPGAERGTRPPAGSG
jgi:4'-phosphopantetheinyl transferase